jgi:predicted dehydrogenase
MTKLRFGLLGTGYWAVQAHGTALKASPEAALAGVWGRDPAKTAAAAAELGTTGYDDIEALIAASDAVAFAVPPDVQATLGLRAARAGRHLLLEKPLALDPPAARALAQAVEDADVAAVVFFTQRFSPGNERWIEQAVQDGPWHSAHLAHYANIFQPGNPFGASRWRRERGALWDIGPHALSVLLPVMGPVTSVAARRGPAGSDTVHMLLAHGRGPSGAAALPGSPVSPRPTTVSASTVSLSLTMPPAASANTFSLYGENGVRVRPDNTSTPADALALAVHELVQLVASGERQHRCDARFGLEVVEVLAAAEMALDLAAVEL